MAIDTGFIEAANNISKTYLSGVQPIADALDPQTRAEIANKRRLADLVLKQNQAATQGSINSLADMEKKRADIQNILKSSQSYDENGNLVLDHEKFISGVEALHPEEAQNIRKNYLANDTAAANLDIKSTEADQKTLENILDLATLGRDVPAARDFVINTAKKNNAELAQLLEQNKENEDFWRGVAANTQKNLELLKAKNDTRRIEQRDEEIQMGQVRLNQGQQRLGQKQYDPQTGFLTAVETPLPFNTNTGAQTQPAQVSQPAKGSEAATVQAMLGDIPANQEQSPEAVQANLAAIEKELQNKDLNATQRGILEQERNAIYGVGKSASQPAPQAGTPTPAAVRQSFVGTPKEEQKEAIKKLNEKLMLADTARKNNEQLDEIRKQLKAGAYTGKLGVLLSSAAEWLPQWAVPTDVVNKISAGQVLDKEAMSSMITGLKNAFSGRIFVNEFDAWAKANVNRKLNDGAIEQLLYLVQKTNGRVIKDADTAKQIYEKQGNLRGFESAIAQEQKEKEQAPKAAPQGVPVPATPKQTTSGSPQRITNKAQYDALPRGAKYIAPDGTIRTKG